MSLDVPVSEGILRVVVLVASDLNLLETPLREVDITSSQVAAHDRVFETESSG
jgi:hypothetical protein